MARGEIRIAGVWIGEESAPAPHGTTRWMRVGFEKASRRFPEERISLG